MQGANAGEEHPLIVFDCLRGAAAGRDLFAGVKATVPTAVLVLRLRRDPKDPFAAWLVDGVAAVYRCLREVAGLSGAGGRPWSVVFAVEQSEGLEDDHAEAAEACYEAARGIAQAATVESPGLFRCNVVRGEETQGQDIRRTVALLASNGGGFSAGNTYDLKETP